MAQILIQAKNLTHRFGARPLFQNLNFSIEAGDRMALIGFNGAGKSTLLKILAGRIKPNDGEIAAMRGLKLSTLDQTPEFIPGATIHSTLLERIKDPDDWEIIARADEIYSKFKLSDYDRETLVENLSGGLKKRVALGRELLYEPDLLLLDEPTNHLDLESILWLEEWLKNASFATLTITHDRAFMDAVSDSILELDPKNKDGILKVKGSYHDYLEIKLLQSKNLESQEARLKNTLRRETEWLRRGAKARTTKQQARIKSHGALSDQVENLSTLNFKRTLDLEFKSEERNPKKLIEVKSISKSYGKRELFKNLNLLLTPKTRLGLLGPNGAGKSTLIKALLKTEAVDSGEVNHAEKLSVSYFEQNRETLDPDLTLYRTLCPEGEFVDYQGRRMHARGLLDQFLFRTDQHQLKVGSLSGGEQSRLSLLLLMIHPANVLVLDEPTNDLDLETLNLLADAITEFNGAVILVTHDRFFLDQVCNKILSFEDEGLLTFQDLSQWEEYREGLKNKGNAQARSKKEPEKNEEPKAKKKLSFNEEREWAGLEAIIHSKEEKLKTLTVESEAAGSNAKRILELTKEMGALSLEIEKLYARWSELDAMKG